MNVISKKAEILWELLQEEKNAEFSNLIKESKLDDIEFWAAIGWLSCEGKLDCRREMENGKNKIYFSLI